MKASQIRILVVTSALAAFGFLAIAPSRAQTTAKTATNTNTAPATTAPATTSTGSGCCGGSSAG